ncbi:MAG: glycosyltransferase family 39 protein [PVC group bacterium]
MQTPITPKIIARIALGLIIVSFCFRLHLLFVRYIDPDEMEYLHAAYCVRSGMVPYRDFFQHHAPLYYYLLGAVYAGGISPAAIFLGRTTSLLFTLLILALTYRLAERLGDRTAAWVATVWLSFNFVFLWRTVEIRPDLPALFFYLIGLNLLLDGMARAGKNRAFWAGAALGLAALCTQKILFPLLGMMAGLLFFLTAETGNTPSSRPAHAPLVLSFLGGLLLPPLLCALYFLARGALPDLIRCSLFSPLDWKRKDPPFHLKTLVFYNPYFSFWGAVGLIESLSRSFRKDSHQEAVAAFSALTALLGSWLIPVSLPQYYLFFIPLLAVFGSSALVRFMKYLFIAPLLRRAAGGILILLPGFLIPALLHHLGYRFELPIGGFYSGLALTACLGAVGFGLLLKKRKAWRRWAPFFLAFAILARPALALGLYHRSDNRQYLDALRYLMGLTGSEEKVMDGWTGLGVFRPHAYYYYYLHEGVLSWLGEEEKGEDLLAALRENPPALVIAGPYLDRLSPAVRDYIGANYRPVSPGHPFLVRAGK